MHVSIYLPLILIYSLLIDITLNDINRYRYNTAKAAKHYSLTAMAIRVSLSLDESQVQQTKCWAWSIFPLIIWTRILGVNLSDKSNSSAKHHQWLIFAYGGFCLLCHLAGQIDILYYLQGKLKMGSLERSGGLNFETSTATWNSIIDFINYAVHGIGTHVLMLTVIRKRWINLMETFRRSEDMFSDERYIRIRKVATYGVAYVILLVCISFMDG
jgi:gustatory receptor